MFLGEYTYSLDEKKRLAIPPRFRAELGTTAVLTRGLDRCLFLYPAGQWQELAEKIHAMPISQSDVRGFARLMLAGAMEENLDAAGRIVVPDYLKEYAGLEKKVIVAGLFARIEIWDEAQWVKYKEKAEEEAGDMAERLKELGV